jgi:glycosyltransferase involved in cell wall biosynthesis
MSEIQQDPYEKYNFSYWDELPSISCWMATFARESLVEEALESFLRQDYPGKKELIIINGNPEQTLVFDHPEVTIHNARERFGTISAKQRYVLSFCNNDFIAPWASDDIHLPSRLSRSFERMNKGGPMLHIPDHPQNFHYYAPGKWFVCQWGKDEIKWQISLGYDNGATIYSKAAYANAVIRGVEVDHCVGSIMEARFRDAGYWSHDPDLEPVDIYYIYRRFPEHEEWYNLDQAQKSGMKEKGRELTARNEESANAGRDWLAKYARKGIIHLNPHWKFDYYDVFFNAYRGTIRMGDLWEVSSPGIYRIN